MGTSRRDDSEMPPMIASSIRSKEAADFCLIVVFERVKSKIFVNDACKEDEDCFGRVDNIG